MKAQHSFEVRLGNDSKRDRLQWSRNSLPRWLAHFPWKIDAILWLIFFTTQPAFAQTAVDDFNPNVHGTIYAVALQADGKIIIGGEFTSVGGVGRTNLTRLRTDGSVDTSFHTHLARP